MVKLLLLISGAPMMKKVVVDEFWLFTESLLYTMQITGILYFATVSNSNMLEATPASEVMQKTGGKSNPQAVNQILRENLGNGGK